MLKNRCTDKFVDNYMRKCVYHDDMTVRLFVISILRVHIQTAAALHNSQCVSLSGNVGLKFVIQIKDT